MLYVATRVDPGICIMEVVSLAKGYPLSTRICIPSPAHGVKALAMIDIE